MLPLDGQETRAEKTNLTVDILTGFYARYRGLPSRFRNGPAAGQQTRLSAPPGLPSVAISVGTTPMIAIPVAAFMGPVAMIVGPAPQIRCNDFGHGRPMIAIPAADDCGSLQVATPLSRRQIDHPSPLNADSTRRRRCVFLLCVPRRTCWFSSGSALGTA
jgi:hypothetical protein